MSHIKNQDAPPWHQGQRHPRDVEAAQPANVDTVVIDGRILKRRGGLTALDPRQVVSEASEALAGVRNRANWW